MGALDPSVHKLPCYRISMQEHSRLRACLSPIGIPPLPIHRWRSRSINEGICRKKLGSCKQHPPVSCPLGGGLLCPEPAMLSAFQGIGPIAHYAPPCWLMREPCPVTLRCHAATPRWPSLAMKAIMRKNTQPQRNPESQTPQPIRDIMRIIRIIRRECHKEGVGPDQTTLTVEEYHITI